MSISMKKTFAFSAAKAAPSRKATRFFSCRPLPAVRESKFSSGSSGRPARSARYGPGKRQERGSRQVHGGLHGGKGLDIVLIDRPVAVELRENVHAVGWTSDHSAQGAFRSNGVGPLNRRAAQQRFRAIQRTNQIGDLMLHAVWKRA